MNLIFTRTFTLPLRIERGQVIDLPVARINCGNCAHCNVVCLNVLEGKHSVRDCVDNNYKYHKWDGSTI
jgi:hypothetical protein